MCNVWGLTVNSYAGGPGGLLQRGSQEGLCTQGLYGCLQESPVPSGALPSIFYLLLSNIIRSSTTLRGWWSGIRWARACPMSWCRRSSRFYKLLPPRYVDGIHHQKRSSDQCIGPPTTHSCHDVATRCSRAGMYSVCPGIHPLTYLVPAGHVGGL